METQLSNKFKIYNDPLNKRTVFFERDTSYENMNDKYKTKFF